MPYLKSTRSSACIAFSPVCTGALRWIQFAQSNRQPLTATALSCLAGLNPWLLSPVLIPCSLQCHYVYFFLLFECVKLFVTLGSLHLPFLTPTTCFPEPYVLSIVISSRSPFLCPLVRESSIATLFHPSSQQLTHSLCFPHRNYYSLKLPCLCICL